MARHISAMVLVTVVVFLYVSFFTPFGKTTSDSLRPIATTEGTEPPGSAIADTGSGLAAVPDSVLTGDVIAPKLENATAKAELGRAAWKVLHTMMARFPEKPTKDESTTLRSYIQLFARLYPCGDCARHFQQLLAKFPPQVGSRNAAAGWACFVHNQVNERLEKPLFDCNNIGDFYDCGCGDEDGKGKGKTEGGAQADKDTSELKLE